MQFGETMTKTIRDKLLEGIASGPPVLADDAYCCGISSPFTHV
jgi:hypothetical protein